MLDTLRAAVNSWPARILLGLVLLSFVAWGGHSAFQAGTDDTLLTAGKTSVSAPTYDLTLRNETLRLSVSMGRYLTADEMKRLGVQQAVFGEVYRNILLDNAAAHMRLGASDKNAAEILSRDPLFHDKDGKFDLSAFNFYLQNLRAARGAFLNDFYVKAARRLQISATLTDGADAPALFYKAFALYAGQTRSVDYAKISLPPQSAVADADNAVLSAWFQANADKFRTPEYRQIRYIRLTAQDISAPAQADEAAVKAYYLAHQEEYLAAPEKRSFTLVRFADKKSAEAARAAIEAAIKGGKSAAEAYSAYFAMHGDLKQEKQADSAQADLPALTGAEIFSMQSGAISPVITDLEGYALVLLQGVTPAQALPLADVSARIKQELSRAQALKALPDIRKKIEDSRYDGADLQEIARQYHLPLHEITLSKDGRALQGQKADFPQADSLLPHIFAAAENTDADPLNLQNGGYLWYNVDKIIPPHPSALADVREKAMSAWKLEQRRQRLDAEAEKLAAALNKGGDFAALARAGGLTPHHSAALSRTAKESGLSPQAVSAIFSAMKGESGMAEGARGDTRIVFRVNAIAEPHNAGRSMLPAAEQNSIAEHMRADLLGLYLKAEAQQTPVKLNQTLYNRLMQEQN